MMCNRNSKKVEISVHGLMGDGLMRKAQLMLDLKE